MEIITKHEYTKVNIVKIKSPITLMIEHGFIRSSIGHFKICHTPLISNNQQHEQHYLRKLACKKYIMNLHRPNDHNLHKIHTIAHVPLGGTLRYQV